MLHGHRDLRTILRREHGILLQVRLGDVAFDDHQRVVAMPYREAEHVDEEIEAVVDVGVEDLGDQSIQQGGPPGE